MDGRDIDAHLFEYATRHDGHHTAAGVFAGLSRPLPARAREFAGGQVAERTLVLRFDRFEGAADLIAKVFHPFAHTLLAVFVRGHDGKPFVWRKASPSTMAPTCATLSERSPAFIGIERRASARACTASGTPALSLPRRRTSPAPKTNSV